MSWLWALLPDEFMVVVIIGVGLALMVGLIAGRRAWQILGTIFLVLLLAPFVEALVASLPWWLLLLGLVVLVFASLRAFASLFISLSSFKD